MKRTSGQHKCKGVFITGTGTEVGKTVVTAALVERLRRSGVYALPMKPVQTGCSLRSGQLASPDLDSIFKWLRLDATAKKISLMCPYRYTAACSPHLASRMEGSGRSISISRIKRCFDKLAAGTDVVVVEGAGGVLVPISSKTSMVDVMKALGLPILLVSNPWLGTINHTLLSLSELRRAGLEVLGVVFNETRPGRTGYIEKDNLSTIRELGRVPVLAWLKYASSFTGDRQASSRTCNRVIGRFAKDLELVVEALMKT